MKSSSKDMKDNVTPADRTPYIQEAYDAAGPASTATLSVVPKWEDTTVDVPKWEDTTVDVSKWEDTTVDVPKWEDTTVDVPKWEDSYFASSQPPVLPFVNAIRYGLGDQDEDVPLAMPQFTSTEYGGQQDSDTKSDEFDYDSDYDEAVMAVGIRHAVAMERYIICTSATKVDERQRDWAERMLVSLRFFIDTTYCRAAMEGRR